MSRILDIATELYNDAIPWFKKSFVLHYVDMLYIVSILIIQYNTELDI